MDIALKFKGFFEAAGSFVSFNPYSDGYCSEIFSSSSASSKPSASFNPYSDGYCSEILITPQGITYRCNQFCFNPYSDGYCSEIGNHQRPRRHKGCVFQSLF